MNKELTLLYSVLEVISDVYCAVNIITKVFKLIFCILTLLGQSIYFRVSVACTGQISSGIHKHLSCSFKMCTTVGSNWK